MSFRTRGVNIIIKGERDDKYGYLKIAFRVGNKTRVKSLGVKVLKKDFNTRTQLMRASAPDAEEINKLLEIKRANKQFVPYKSNRPKTMVGFIQRTIDNTIVKSTKQKYENLLNLFQSFLKEKYDKEDLFFEEFDDLVATELYNWFLTKEKKNTTNTANYKIKAFKAFVSKIERTGLFKYQISPFVSLKLSFDDTKKDFLNINELQALIRSEITDTRKIESKIRLSLKDIKDAFIFSTLAQGIRISDIMTLRWNDFIFSKEFVSLKKSLVIRKKMIKTKKNVFLLINADCSQFIENQVERMFKTYLDENSGGIYSTFIHYENCRYDFNNIKEQMLSNERMLFLDDTIDANEIKDFNKALKEDLKKMAFSKFIDFYSLIQFLSTDETTKTKFVFPFLDDKLFNNIDENNYFSKLTDEQFLQFQGRRSYINLLLKTNLFKKISSKKLSFHSSRHTYTSLMLDNDKSGMNLYDLMNSLGHTSLLSTEKYIRGINYNKIHSLNMNLSKALFDTSKK